MKKNKKTYDDDDGRVIANMDLDYMPWYARKRKPMIKSHNEELNLSAKETFKILMKALLSGIAVGFIVIGIAFLIIIFCLYVWFRVKP